MVMEIVIDDDEDFGDEDRGGNDEDGDKDGDDDGNDCR